MPIVTGTLIISSGVTSNGVFVSGAGNVLDVSSGGIVSNTTEISGGIANIFAGGLIDGFTVSSGGTQNISGGVAEFGQVNGGQENVLSGGVLENATVSSGGIVAVSSGGTASNLSGRYGSFPELVCGLPTHRTKRLR